MPSARCSVQPRTAERDSDLARPLDLEGLPGGKRHAPDVDPKLEQPVAKRRLAHFELLGGRREAVLVDHLGEQSLQGLPIPVLHLLH